MQAEQIFTNARVVSSSEVFLGTVAVRDGQIHDVSPGGSQLPQAQDLEGDYLMPGLIELHTDNLEKYMNQRPGVDWTSESAVLAHDAKNVSARSEEHTHELTYLMCNKNTAFSMK